ncbi:MAG: hypothetical protein Q7S05_01275 [bacterium]|nr:hypothetical protein [bacterium]
MYKFRGKHYIVLLGGVQGFKDKTDVFSGGGEEEVFQINSVPGEPVLEMMRKVIAEADRRGIKDILALEDIFAKRTGVVILQEETRH